MKDAIIKGTGNSRSIKSVPNLAALAPTWEKALEYLTGEGLPVDIGPINPAGVDVVGTSLNKGSLFSDISAANFNLGEDGTPRDAFERLVPCASGSYTGTAYAGTDPKSLTFNFIPKLLIVFLAANQNGQYSADMIGFFVPFSAKNYYQNNSYSIIQFQENALSTYQRPLCYSKIDGNTFTWYFDNAGSGAATRSFNYINQKYGYVAFG